MNIKDVMTTNPSYCVPGDPSTRAARIMKDRNVGIVPIVESDIEHKLIGVVTDRDLCLAIVAENVQPDTVKVLSSAEANLLGQDGQEKDRGR